MQKGELPADFVERRRRLAKKHITDKNRWSRMICKRANMFDKHIQRNSSKRLWSAALAGVRDESWLALMREFWPSHRSRTNTRFSRGKPATRWQHGVQVAKTFLS